MRFRDKLAQMSGRYSDEEWSALVSSTDALDRLTVTNARAIADNILDMESTIGRRILIALESATRE